MENGAAISKNKKNPRSVYLSGFLLFVLSAPYFFWPLLRNVFGMFTVGGILAIVFLFNKTIYSKKNTLLFVFFFVTAVLYWLTSGHNFNFFLLLLPSLVIPFCSDEFAYKTYQSFFTIFSIVISLSIIEYILAVLGVLSPVFSIAPLNSLKLDTYQVYFTLVTIRTPPIRFHGPYDEPGMVGTISAILLCVERFNFKDKKVLITLIAGILSLSLFFYVSVIICWALNKFKTRISVTSMVVIIAALFVSVIIVQQIPVLNEYIAERLTFDSDQGFSGNNRINMLIVNDYLNSMRGNTLWFGITDKEYYMSLVEGSSSIFSTIIVHGLLFFIVYFLFFVIYAWRYRKSVISFVIFLVVFTATSFQRPSEFSIFYVFLFTYLARDVNVANVLPANQ